MSSEVHEISIALIRCSDAPEKQWLAFMDDSETALSFLTADRLEKESWRECLDRELAWRLELRRGKDYLISSMARRHFDETIDDAGDGRTQHFSYEFFVVDPYGSAGRQAFRVIPNSRWVTNEELRNGATNDGVAVSSWLKDLLLKTDLLPKG